MANKDIVDQVSSLAALGASVLDAVKASGLIRTRRRSRRTNVEVDTAPAPKRPRKNPLRGARPVAQSE